MVTATGAIVNRHALDEFNDVYLHAGDVASTMALLHGAALREDWARQRVARAGHDWATHFAKFDGTVMQR